MEFTPLWIRTFDLRHGIPVPVPFDQPTYPEAHASIFTAELPDYPVADFTRARSESDYFAAALRYGSTPEQRTQYFINSDAQLLYHPDHGIERYDGPDDPSEWAEYLCATAVVMHATPLEVQFLAEQLAGSLVALATQSALPPGQLTLVVAGLRGKDVDIQVADLYLDQDEQWIS